jgi:hypothetical protein
MFNFSKAILAAAIVLGGVATVSAASPSTFQDQSGTWHRHSHMQRPAVTAPVHVFPFTIQEQQRLDLAKGNIG